MEFWIIAIPLFFTYIIYLVIARKLQDKKNINSIPKLEQDINELKETNAKLVNVDSQIYKNVIAYREKYESDRQRKIYYANKSKKRFRRY